jgi:hypothetical protein
MADNEFDDDDIDWAAVDLPPALSSSLMTNHNATANNNNASHSHVGHQYANVNATASAAMNTNTNTANESLQMQIAHLQNLLQSKSQRISELEAFVATSNTESSLAAQRAQQEANNRIHLIEEELRRVKREADQYKGQWVRVKKRVTELEAGDTGRAITPNVDHFHNHFGDGKDNAMKEEGVLRAGVKRKSEGRELERREEKTESHVPAVVVVSPEISNYDSVTGRVAKHLLLMDEMGSYSLDGICNHDMIHNVEKCQLASASTDKVEKGKRHEPGAPSESSAVSKSLTRVVEDQLEKEAKAFVKSILCHMVAEPRSTEATNAPHAMSVSGLLRVLLVRFNTLFRDADNSRKESNEMDIDEPMDKHQDIVSLVHLHGRQVHQAVHSWRAALYLLRIIHDILNLSPKAREDLRWWFYQARQSCDSFDDVDTDASLKCTYSQAHSRIEGLPSTKNQCSCNRDRMEVLWDVYCCPNRMEENEWDASTMKISCNQFYHYLVGMMKGPRQQSSIMNKDHEMAQYAQLKATEFVFCLMSDAAPYDHVDLASRSKTPYLWKFWFDSLFPSYSTSGVPSDSPDTGDFFSIWEMGGGSHRMLGSGRRYYTQLLASPVESEALSARQTGAKHSAKLDKIKSTPMPILQQESDLITMGIKSKSLQLMAHFISSSSSLHQSVYQVHTSTAEGVSLAKRVLFAVLDELDEVILPFISFDNTQDQYLRIFVCCLELCHSCVMFLLVLSRSDAGIHLLRIQAKLDFDIGDITRWSSSAIGCVTAVLDAILHHMSVENDKPTVTTTIPLMKAITEQCVLFYKNLLSFVHSSDRPKSKATSLMALVAERHNVFVSCCHRLIATKHHLLSEELKYETRLLLEEVLLAEGE